MLPAPANLTPWYAAVALPVTVIVLLAISEPAATSRPCWVRPVALIVIEPPVVGTVATDVSVVLVLAMMLPLKVIP